MSPSSPFVICVGKYIDKIPRLRICIRTQITERNRFSPTFETELACSAQYNPSLNMQLENDAIKPQALIALCTCAKSSVRAWSSGISMMYLE